MLLPLGQINHKMNLPTALKELRVKKGIKQFQAADGIKITQTYLSQIESGQKVPSIEVLEKLAKFYKTPIAIMLWYSIDEKDIQKSKLTAYRELRPLIDSLINNLI